MKLCKSCQIKYEAPLQTCMFCGNKLPDAADTNSDIPLELGPAEDFAEMISTENTVEATEADGIDLLYNYPKAARQSKPRHFILKLFAFLLVIANIICILTDIKTLDTAGLSWSRYVLSSSIFSFLFLRTLTGMRRSAGKVSILSLLTMIELILIGIFSGNYNWATDYVLPLGILVTNFVMTCCLFGRRSRVYHYLVYVLLFSLLGIILCAFQLLKPVVVDLWPSLACLGYCIIAPASLLVFSTKETKEELRRRLYL